MAKMATLLTAFLRYPVQIPAWILTLLIDVFQFLTVGASNYVAIGSFDIMESAPNES
jgi:hypothetical protein